MEEPCGLCGVLAWSVWGLCGITMFALFVNGAWHGSIALVHSFQWVFMYGTYFNFVGSLCRLRDIQFAVFQFLSLHAAVDSSRFDTA